MTELQPNILHSFVAAAGDRAADLADSEAIVPVTMPSNGLRDFMFETFLDDRSPFYNVKHDHLNSAKIGVILTNKKHRRGMMNTVGQAELGAARPGSNVWAAEREAALMRMWFGTDELDFKITIYAPILVGYHPLGCFAVFEHEFCHCAQRENLVTRAPMFLQSGEPQFGMRRHDVEQFVTVTERYGVQTREEAQFVKAATKRPLFGQAEIAGFCGTCAGRI